MHMSEHESTTTTSHDEIRAWADEHDAVPATVRGTEDDSGAGVLTFDVQGYGADEEQLKHLDWDTWFEKFDASGLALLYQCQKKSGGESTFFRLVDRSTAEDS
jgi:hypothetical protein